MYYNYLEEKPAIGYYAASFKSSLKAILIWDILHMIPTPSTTRMLPQCKQNQKEYKLLRAPYKHLLVFELLKYNGYLSTIALYNYPNQQKIQDSVKFIEKLLWVKALNRVGMQPKRCPYVFFNAEPNSTQYLFEIVKQLIFKDRIDETLNEVTKLVLARCKSVINPFKDTFHVDIMPHIAKLKNVEPTFTW